MSIQPGLYNINNQNNDYAVMMYANDAEGIPIVCVPNPNGQTVSSLDIPCIEAL
jgi:hypothetical protein